MFAPFIGDSYCRFRQNPPHFSVIVISYHLKFSSNLCNSPLFTAFNGLSQNQYSITGTPFC